MRRIDEAVAAGTLVLALLGGACANNDGAGAGAGSGATGPTTGSTGATGSSGGGGGYGYGGGGMTGGTGSGGAADSVKTVKQVNYQFAPATFTVRAGDTITVTDTNPTTPHTFTIAGTDINVTNDAMESQDVTLDLAPGSYDFFCRFHESQGMTGTLVVK